MDGFPPLASHLLCWIDPKQRNPCCFEGNNTSAGYCYRNKITNPNTLPLLPWTHIFTSSLQRVGMGVYCGVPCAYIILTIMSCIEPWPIIHTIQGRLSHDSIFLSFYSGLLCIIVTGLCWGGVYTVPDIWHAGVLLLCTPEYTVFCDKQELHWVQKFDTSALCRGALSRLLKTELPDSKVRCQRMIGGGEAQHPSFHRSSYMFVLYTLYFVLFHRSSYRTPSPSMIFVSCAILSWYNQQWKPPRQQTPWLRWAAAKNIQ